MSGGAHSHPWSAPRDETRHDTGTRRRSVVAVVLLTVLGAVVPGAGLIAAGRVKSGVAVLVGAVVVVVGLVLYIGTDVNAVLSRAFDGPTLRRGAVVALVIAVAWSVVTIVSHRALRPAVAGTAERVGGSLLVGVLCLGISTPLVLGANVLLTTRDVLNNSFDRSVSAITGRATIGAVPPPLAVASGTTTPSATARPTYSWSKPRLNILLLGSDAAGDRTGTRTDSMVVASIDTVTGRVMLVSVPRNLCSLEWKPGTPLAADYPNGWQVDGSGCDGNGDNLINAIYNDVPINHPELFPKGSTDNPGADALALGLSYSLGLPIDYYLLVDLGAFQSIVDAVGGVTVNINTPIPVGGVHDGNGNVTTYPTRWIMPGPRQHLDGKNALWYSRGRFSSDDYARIDRQKCMINAIVRQTSPTKIITSYASLATTLENNVLTDIPTKLLSPLTQLGLKVKDSGSIASITIDPQNIPGMGSSSSPSWDAVRTAVQESLAQTDRPKAPASTSAAPSATSTPAPTGTGPASSSPSASGTATTSSGSSVITNVGTGCRYDPAAAATALAAWKSQWGYMYDDNGQKR